MAAKKQPLYAVVDIETTGGSPVYHRITEIAIIIHNGVEVLNSYNQLVNPQLPIPPKIIQITGITNNLVKNAPTFEQIADKVDELTSNCVFVAHNASFDYGFIKAEFNRIGKTFKRKKLCTVRLSRKIIPGFHSYSLGNIATQLGFDIENRHRAMGDAKFTAQLFGILFQKDKEGFIEYSLNQRNKESALPPNLPKEQFEQLPEALGIYIFYDQKGKIIYVGKANNIKNRVKTHFAQTTNTHAKAHFIKNIYKVDFEICESELIALLKEAHYIKKHWPPYNRTLKNISLNYGVYTYQDQAGYNRLAIAKAGKHDKPIVSYRYHYQARAALINLAKNHTLCPKLLGLQNHNEDCTHFFGLKSCNQTCTKVEDSKTYNLRFEKGLKTLTGLYQDFCLITNSVIENRLPIVLISKGRYLGYGFLPKLQKPKTIDEVKPFIKYGYEDQDIRGIIENYIKLNPNLVQLIPLKN